MTESSSLLLGLKKSLVVAVGAGVMFAGGAIVSQSSASASPASWENCGDRICTTYYSRAETRDLLRTVEKADYYAHQGELTRCSAASGVFGGVVGALLGAIPTVGFGAGAGFAGGATAGLAAGSQVCGLIVGPERSELSDLLDEAVAQDACYQVEYAVTGEGERTGGITDHPDYCFG